MVDVTLSAPYSFNIVKDKPRSRVIRFIKKLRDTVLIEGKSVCINFHDTNRLDASGVLLFVAELHRIKYLLNLRGNGVTITCIPAAKRKVSQVLSNIGVYKCLLTKVKIRIGVDPDVIYWKFATGRGSDGKKYDTILGRYDGSIADKLSRKLYVGVTEAMSNAHNHAHIGARSDGLAIKLEDELKDWWMFSQERDGKLMVVFCDLGVGIPGSLPQKHPTLWQALITIFGQTTLSDGQIIKEATNVTVSRTGASHRGRGLKQMVTAITGEFGGKVSIFSNKGLYSSDGAKESVENFSTSILGTIITWATPLRKDCREANHEQHYHKYR